MNNAQRPEAGLELLTALGFSPDSTLMNEPRIFVDRRFLGTLILELEDELDPAVADSVLFQIGFMHGLRDAARVVDASFRDEDAAPSVAAAPETPPLAIRFDAGLGRCAGGELELPGSWPEKFEAEARLSKLGPAETHRCHLSAGYTSGWLSGTLGSDILVRETECASCGGARCRFIAREVAGWRELSDPLVDLLIENLPFDLLRDIAVRDLPLRGRGRSATLDPRSNDIHIWGPVMILPFTSADGILEAVDMLGRDPETAAVRVVVVDLRQQVINQDFDAAALETALEAIEAWGAETILTGVSPLSELTVAELASSHLLLRKDLSEAVAAAFQVAEAQRHLV